LVAWVNGWARQIKGSKVGNAGFSEGAVASSATGGDRSPEWKKSPLTTAGLNLFRKEIEETSGLCWFKENTSNCVFAYQIFDP